MPFIQRPDVPTYAITVTATSASQALAPTKQSNTVRFVNVGTNAVFVALTNAPTAPTATAPAAGSPQNVIALAPNSTTVVSFGSPTFVAAVSGAVGNTLYVSVGSDE